MAGLARLDQTHNNHQKHKSSEDLEEEESQILDYLISC